MSTSKQKTTMPFPFQLSDNQSTDDIINWFRINETSIQKHLYSCGAVLLKNTGINSVDKFHSFTKTTFPKFRDYVDGNYPRKKLKDHVYISTEYDPKFDITLHNELSYSENWPSKLIFCCCIPPAHGGETPLVDSRLICKYLPAEILEEFETKNIKYIRNLHGGNGMGPSWQETFETDNEKEVESVCKKLNIELKWKSNRGLKLISKRPSTRLHPVTQEKVWFNQVDQYHPSHFPQEVYETLLMVNDGIESELPLYVTFGDDTPVSADILKEVKKTIDGLMVVRKWNRGDIVIVDNMLVAHGRKAYQGDRKIIVSMAV